ncbi:olfactory receptor 51I2-like [Neoarius graeffei]|uniref:olfactory receptor 51I2-like n=1 Tax=Neoarius graeffei TaxID=443677 RepID=UPI00298CBD54|nr:olfactory receptor 51I2-like [Neoarius graeffei]
MTHDCCARPNSNHINKFADDTTVVGLISNDDDSAYREEVHQLINCAVESVKSTKFLGVHITDDLTWTTNTTSLVKKAQQRLHFLCRMRRADLPPSALTTFYRGAIESILTSSLGVKMVAETSLINSNLTRFMAILTMEKLDLPPSSALSVFIFGIITYCLILFLHSMLLVAIVVKKDLHKPMYILLFNLSICDLLGSTAFYPQLVCSILSQTREISYLACALQGLFIHLYGNGSLLFLTVMSYDRYIAICQPLRYHNIMTQAVLIKFIFLVWSVNCTMIGTSFVLTLSKEICRTNIVDTFCNNPSLMRLSCEDTRVVNYYGLFTIALSQGSSVLIVSLTYIKILITCLSTQQKNSIRKAMQTCGTHLVVFLSFEVNGFLALLSHRLETVSPHLRRAFGVSIIIFPPILNPLIYGLKTREIRQTIFKFFKRKIASR